MSRIVNLTPHTLNIHTTVTCLCGTADFQQFEVWWCGSCGAEGITEDDIVDVGPCGTVARVETVETNGQTAIMNGLAIGGPSGPRGIVSVRTRTTGAVVGLPDPKAGVVYVVSGMVRSALEGRPDVFSPGPLVRDASGRPVGCRGLFS